MARYASPCATVFICWYSARCSAHGMARKGWSNSRKTLSLSGMILADDSVLQYTFRSESRIDADPHGLGNKVYTRLAKRCIENGTTCAALYGTISTEAKSVSILSCCNAMFTATNIPIPKSRPGGRIRECWPSCSRWEGQHGSE